MHTKLLPQPGHHAAGVLSTLGLSLFRFPVRGVPGGAASARSKGMARMPASSGFPVKDAARQLRTRQVAPPTECDINQVLHRMVRIARTLVPSGVRIAERYAPLEQSGRELPEFHQVVLHLILDAAQAVNGIGTIDVESRCDNGAIVISISDTRSSQYQGWGLVSPLLGTSVPDHVERTSLGVLMAGDFAEEHGGRVRTLRLPKGGHAVQIVLPTVMMQA